MSTNKQMRSFVKSMNTPRYRVMVPPLPKVGPLAKNGDFEQMLDDWLDSVRMAKAEALVELAESRGADPKELAKVADLLLELHPAETRGRKSVDVLGMFFGMAIELNRGASEQVACDLVGVDAKTFRAHREQQPKFWKMILDFADVHPDPRRYMDELGKNK